MSKLRKRDNGDTDTESENDSNSDGHEAGFRHLEDNKIWKSEQSEYENETDEDEEGNSDDEDQAYNGYELINN